MKNIKYYYDIISMYWNLKSILTQLPLITVGVLALSLIVTNDFQFALIFIPAIWIIPIVTLTCSWFMYIKPMIKDAEKQAELNNKYYFFRDKFTTKK